MCPKGQRRHEKILQTKHKKTAYVLCKLNCYVYVKQIGEFDFKKGLLWTVGQLIVQVYESI